MSYGPSQYAGESGFYWWIGKVDSIEDDPKSSKLGMARVKIFNLHDDVKDNTALPWAQCMLPVTSPSVRGVGDTPSLLVGSIVFGFFADAVASIKQAKVPIIMGTIPVFPSDTDHSIPLDARGKRSINKKAQKVGNEPDDPYKASYPSNRVIKTQSGHMIELDDTPGAERVHIYHKSGSYIEMSPDGGVTVKSVKDSFDIVGGIKNIYVAGDCKVQVDGSMNAIVKGPINMVGQSDLSLIAKGRLFLQGMLGIKMSSGSDIAMEAPGGVAVTDGSLSVIDELSVGTGATGSIIAGGRNLQIRDGIIVGISDT